MQANPFSAPALIARYRAKKMTGYIPHDDSDGSITYLKNIGMFDDESMFLWKKSAVLIPVINYSDEACVLFTLRSDNLHNHAGQISFPGGKFEESDISPAMTALRESYEEISLLKEFVDIVGTMPSYYTGTGYRIKPVLGIVAPQAELHPNPDEVASIFEVPLSFLMNPVNHKRQTKRIGNKDISFDVIQYQDHSIWGATAGIIRMLYERLYR